MLSEGSVAANPKLAAEAKKRIKVGTSVTSKPKKGSSGATAALNPPGTTYVQVGGQTIAVPPGQKYVPGSAGVLNPTIEPFLTGNDMMEQADSNFNLESGLYDLDTALSKLSTDTEYNKKQITKSEGEAKSATVDNMIARGLFNSSVKDGEIYDIQATATMRRNFLDTTFKTAEMETGIRKGALRSRADAIQKAIDRKAAENAQLANENAPDYLEPPTQGGLQPIPGAPKPAAAPRAKTAPKKPTSKKVSAGYKAGGPGKALW
jgi:hypothetical protein